MTVIDHSAMSDAPRPSNPGPRWQASIEAAWIQSWKAAGSQGHASHSLAEAPKNLPMSQLREEASQSAGVTKPKTSPQATQTWLDERVSQQRLPVPLMPETRLEAPSTHATKHEGSDTADGAMRPALTMFTSCGRGAALETTTRLSEGPPSHQLANAQAVVLPSKSLFQVAVNQGLVRINIRDVDLDERSTQQTLLQLEDDLAAVGHADWQVHLNGKQYSSTQQRLNIKE